ncbi:anthranilate phosphoribosyltransferase [Helicobacter baculiformis]|uniref:Anthranilate phosphoribosyltransferase n=1 Tax=Helicobacter baculiformis TaxID=427351 RepID=A0ABV7ZFB9_9HELI|nr:anthranilate phosphoribosyltransferase [Helicobacter baculiformis]
MSVSDLGGVFTSLYQRKSLTNAQVTALFTAIAQGELSIAQLSAALIALKMKPESAREIASAARFCLQLHPKPCAPLCYDNCGTGGDGMDSINVSTISALVCASMGVPMAKHGNKSSSNAGGSADLLEFLGVNIAMHTHQALICLQRTNFTFLFAPLYYPNFAHVAKVRKELKTRTIFNLIGPLINPLAPKAQLLGVYDSKFCLPLARALRKLGVNCALVVHGAGLDEIAVHGDTLVCELQGKEIKQYTLSPKDFGLKPCTLEALRSQSLQMSAHICLELLQGRGSYAHQASIAANSAGLLYLAGKATSFKEGVEMALAHLKSAQAYTHLQHIIKNSHV